MATVHERAADTLLDEILFHPEAASTFALVRSRLANEEFTPEYVDVIGQMFAKGWGKWPLNQVAAFVRVHAGIGAGEYARVVIQVDEWANADLEREKNAAALVDLPEPFVATVNMAQNGADEDGFLEWKSPIVVMRSTGASLLDSCPREGEGRVFSTRAVGAGKVPLEIGYTMPSRTLAHLQMDGGVARWPYESDEITLLVNLSRFAKQPDPAEVVHQPQPQFLSNVLAAIASTT